MAITTRPINEDEVLEFRQRLYRGFGEDLDLEKDADSSRMLALLPLDRTVAAFDGDDMVGTGGWYPMEVTVPGGDAVPMAGTTIISVQPTHRRQGVLTAMMRDHLDHTARSGEPLAGLWASETPIYGRFGFGHEQRQTLREIGGRLGLSRERVRQIESAALERLREGLEERDLLDTGSGEDEPSPV